MNDSGYGESGRLLVGKFAPDADLGFVASSDPRITDFQTPYLLQLEVQTVERPGDQDYVTLEANLFDETGSTLLMSASSVDFGSGEYPIYASGYSGVRTDLQWRNVSLDAAFDDIASVTIPEPSSILLIALGVLGVTVRRHRGRM